MGGRDASGPVGSEHGLSRDISKDTVLRHVRAGAIDNFLNLGFVDRSTRMHSMKGLHRGRTL